jgi:hypothetical protein
MSAIEELEPAREDRAQIDHTRRAVVVATEARRAVVRRAAEAVEERHLRARRLRETTGCDRAHARDREKPK